MKSLTDLIKEQLTVWPETRDDDMLLVSSIWTSEIKNKNVNPGQESYGKDIKKMSAFQLMDLMIRGFISSPIAITAVKKVLQDDYPDLRGETYVHTVRQYL